VTPELEKLLATGIPWLVNIIVEACKGEPAPTQAEAEARITGALRDRAGEWLPVALEHADGVYDGK
jgi:hypothetical protein